MGTQVSECPLQADGGEPVKQDKGKARICGWPAQSDCRWSRADWRFGGGPAPQAAPRAPKCRCAGGAERADDMDRRKFLRQAGGLVGLGLAACVSPVEPADTPGALTPGRRRQRFVVVGAGMSGLVAAYELGRAGHVVTVLEARPRVGGRVLTLRAPFASGHLAEAGAARILPAHNLTLSYARHFGLPVDRFYPDRGRYLRVRAGRRATVDPETFLASKPDFVKIRGGSDLLPHALADALVQPVVTGAPVGEIRAGRPVRVVAMDGRSWDADRVLVAVPVTVLARIRFVPGLSAQKREALNGGFRYESATRVFFRMKKRFWVDERLNGWGTTDWPEELWHPTWDSIGTEGVLATYVREARARELDRLIGRDRAAAVLGRWDGFLRGASANALSGVSHSWQRDPWSLGGWAAPTARQDRELADALARPEGPVHFAGEHISGARGWMNGAIESGLRAATRIHGR